MLLEKHCVLVGPNGCGKSTLIDALCLVLGRPRMVRPLTEHDFHGGNPKPEDRIRIVATLSDFPVEDPDLMPDWFGAKRGVPKWIDAAGHVHPSASVGRELCVELGFAARFDFDELVVEPLRYFHDHDDAADPFDDSAPVEHVPSRLINEVGFFVLPARRGWEGTASFASDLFRRTVSNAAGLPVDEIIAQRDRVRAPEAPVEASPALADLVGAIDDQLSRLLLDKPKFKLRLTAGDSEAVLQALLPHYSVGNVTLPVSRHGAGLLSLQTLLLLLEVGRARRKKNLHFLLALEEPELHLAPGLRGRLIRDAVAVSEQTICTTHSPGIAAKYAPTQVFVVRADDGVVSGTPLRTEALNHTASSDDRKLYHQNLGRLVEAVMHPFVLVPEGRFDREWFSRLIPVGESRQKGVPFSTVYGVAPTESAAVLEMAMVVRRLRPGVIAVVDGDAAGDGYVAQLRRNARAAQAVLQWPKGWMVEDIVGWLVAADEPTIITGIADAFGRDWSINSCADLVAVLKVKNDRSAGTRGLKEDVVAHDALVAALSEPALDRLALLLDAMTAVALDTAHANVRIEATPPVPHLRFSTT